MKNFDHIINEAKPTHRAPSDLADRVMAGMAPRRFMWTPGIVAASFAVAVVVVVGVRILGPGSLDRDLDAVAGSVPGQAYENPADISD